MSKAARDERIIFRKQDRIGANDAEEDAEFLEDCFVDTGDLHLLRDCLRPERIVLGRTGAGKTALLMKLLEIEQRAMEVKPANLALSYISNSTILQFFEGVGVNLDPFYKLIWRHAFCVVVASERSCWDMMYAACSVFFRVGMVGIKPSPTETFTWYADTGRRYDATEFTRETSIRVHPMFWRSLGINPSY